MNRATTTAWQQYEAGRAYKRRIGLYETVRKNERFYRGDQWAGVGGDLPKPVFNVIRRVVDYLICSVAAGTVSVSFSDEHLPFLEQTDEATAQVIRDGIEVLSRNARYRWECCRMDRLTYRLLTDAAISGDGVFYCYWDTEAQSGQPYRGDIATELIDNTNLFVADVNRADIQSQAYVILAGRERVSALREEARRYGAEERDVMRILPDGESERGERAGELSVYELEGEDAEKTTYLIKFWREDGKVVFEKSTRDCVIRRQKTDCTKYPVAYFNWYPTKNAFHGTSPITGLIPNQKYINRAYAMVMKHMTDTAFSKVVYDKSRIPEWSNQVGEAIAAVGAVNVSDAVSVIGTGQMQDGYLELIQQVIAQTKELMGATDTALGNTSPNNTSAILALQDAAKIPLEQMRSAFYQCVEDLANIWADMMCAYYPSERLLPYREEDGVKAGRVDFDLLRKTLLRARVEVSTVTGYSSATVQSVLDRLLEGGHITLAQYVARLPDGVMPERQELLDEIAASESAESNEKEEEHEQAQTKAAVGGAGNGE